VLKVGDARLVLRDPRRKSIFRIIVELLWLGATQRVLPRHYFTNYLYWEGVCNLRGYATNRELKSITHGLYEPQGIRHPELDDKVAFSGHLESHQLPAPRVLAVLKDGIAESTVVPRIRIGQATGEALVRDLLIASDGRSIFLKPASGSGGKSCALIADASPGWNRVIFQSRNHALIQEAVLQHPVMAAVNPFSVNTVRVHTYRTNPDSTPEIVSALVRFGTGTSVVDNASSGGIYASLDLATGCLTPPARSFYEHGARHFWKHPNTGFVFSRFRLPYLDEVISLARSGASTLSLQFIGWDIAITPTGPVILEANHRPNLKMLQVAAGGIWNDPALATVFDIYRDAT
jgi:hypothetical protein